VWAMRASAGLSAPGRSFQMSYYTQTTCHVIVVVYSGWKTLCKQRPPSVGIGVRCTTTGRTTKDLVMFSRTVSHARSGVRFHPQRWGVVHD